MVEELAPLTSNSYYRLTLFSLNDKAYSQRSDKCNIDRMEAYKSGKFKDIHMV